MRWKRREGVSPPGQHPAAPARHRCLHSSRLPKRFSLPRQPPYTKASHWPVSTLKKNLGSEALQGPVSARYAQNWWARPTSGDTGPAGRATAVTPDPPRTVLAARASSSMALPDLQKKNNKQAALRNHQRFPQLSELKLISSPSERGFLNYETSMGYSINTNQ